MTRKYLDLMFTASVRRLQKEVYGTSGEIRDAPDRDPLGQDEIEFIRARDSFYLGTTGESGWPYVQHRGGPPGFLRVINDSTLAFADYRGNRQLLTAGNLSANDRVALFLMDYRNQARLKILGHGRTESARGRPDLVAQVSGAGVRARIERVIIIDVVSFDWNCRKHITPRYSPEEVEELVGALKSRIAELEAMKAPGFDRRRGHQGSPLSEPSVDHQQGG